MVEKPHVQVTCPSSAEGNLVDEENEESSSKRSIARPLACGLFTALLVLSIGLVAWVLAGVDQRSQLLARFADVDRSIEDG